MSRCHHLILHQGDVKSQRDGVEGTDPTSRKWQSQSFSRAFLPLPTPISKGEISTYIFKIEF